MLLRILMEIGDHIPESPVLSERHVPKGMLERAARPVKGQSIVLAQALRNWKNGR
jgi:hypothetical protein